MASRFSWLSMRPADTQWNEKLLEPNTRKGFSGFSTENELAGHEMVNFDAHTRHLKALKCKPAATGTDNVPGENRSHGQS